MGEGAHKFSKPGKILENYIYTPLVYKIQQVDELEVIAKSMVGFGHVNNLKPNWIPVALLPLGGRQTIAPSVLSVNMIVLVCGKFGSPLSNWLEPNRKPMNKSLVIDTWFSQIANKCGMS